MTKTNILKFITAITVVIAGMFTTTNAAPIYGTWKGKLTVNGSNLNIVFHFDGDKCTMDSPNQNASGIPAIVNLNDRDSVNVKDSQIGNLLQSRTS